MHGHLTACAWVSVADGCPMTCQVGGSGAATVEFGQHGASLEVQFGSEALRELIALATNALQDMDHRYVRERTSPPEQVANKEAISERAPGH